MSPLLLWHLHRILISGVGWIPQASLRGNVLVLAFMRKRPGGKVNWGGQCRGYDEQVTRTTRVPSCWNPLRHSVEYASDLSYLRGKKDVYVYTSTTPCRDLVRAAPRNSTSQTALCVVWVHSRDQRKPLTREWLMFSLKRCHYVGEE